MTARLGTRRIRARVRAFIQDTRAGATAIASALVTVMTVGGAALITDHVWLYDQRDVLKTAAEAASIAATLDIDRQLAKNPRISDPDLKAALEPVAKRYVLVNLAHLAPERFNVAEASLEVTLDLNRAQRTVGVTARADLGGTLFSRNLPLLGNYTGPEKVAASAGVESESTPVEVVLALDVSGSMAMDLGGQNWRIGLGDDSRLDIVKRAAANLVAILNPNDYNRVAVGIVPWFSVVRLDAQRAGKWADAGWAAHAGTGTPPPVWQGCLDKHLRIDAGTPKAPAPTPAALLELPADAPFVRTTCEEHLVDPAKYIKQLMPTLFPLSTNRADVEDSIDALTITGGGTYSSLGVLWAQRMLEPTWKSVWGGSGIHPADSSTPEHAELRKAIVLLTDGLDSDSKLNGISLAHVCDMAKERDTEIFVVAAMRPSDVSGALGKGLRDCSSEADDEKYYPEGTRRPGATYVFLNNATPEALQAAFTDIANQLRTLRKVS